MQHGGGESGREKRRGKGKAGRWRTAELCYTTGELREALAESRRSYAAVGFSWGESSRALA